MLSRKPLLSKTVPKIHNPALKLRSPDIHGKKLPLFYFIFANLFALAPYYFILLFPILFIASVYNAYILFPYYSNSDPLAMRALLWSTLSLFFGHISYTILAVDLTTVPGLKIKRKSAPLLYKLLDDIQRRYNRPKIKQIIVTGNFELKLVKVPYLGIPLFCRNVVLVGLPLMLTLSPGQFNCLCTREIIQHSKNRLFTANWLNQMRELWSRYLIVLNPRSCIGHQLLYWFFRVYCPVYNATSLPARLMDELNADRNALDLINSDELISAFQASLRANIFLRKDFWPRIQNTIAAREAGLRPLTLLSRTAKTVLLQINSSDWLQKHYISEECAEKQLPTLTQRMDNLGLSTITLPPDLTQTAAEYYFQDHYAKIILMSDDNWRETQYPGTQGRPVSLPNRLSTLR